MTSTWFGACQPSSPTSTMAATIPLLAAQITATMQWIPLIQCIGDLTDTVSNNIPAGQAGICWSDPDIEARKP